MRAVGRQRNKATGLRLDRVPGREFREIWLADEAATNERFRQAPTPHRGPAMPPNPFYRRKEGRAICRHRRGQSHRGTNTPYVAFLSMSGRCSREVLFRRKSSHRTKLASLLGRVNTAEPIENWVTAHQQRQRCCSGTQQFQVGRNHARMRRWLVFSHVLPALPRRCQGQGRAAPTSRSKTGGECKPRQSSSSGCMSAILNWPGA